MDLPSCVRSSFLIPQESELSKKRKCESLEQKPGKSRGDVEELGRALWGREGQLLGPSGPPGGGPPRTPVPSLLGPEACFPSCLAGLPFPG